VNPGHRPASRSVRAATTGSSACSSGCRRQGRHDRPDSRAVLLSRQRRPRAWRRRRDRAVGTVGNAPSSSARDPMLLLRLQRGKDGFAERQQPLRHQSAQFRVVGRNVVLQAPISARAMLAGTDVTSPSSTTTAAGSGRERDNARPLPTIRRRQHHLFVGQQFRPAGIEDAAAAPGSVARAAGSAAGSAAQSR